MKAYSALLALGFSIALLSPRVASAVVFGTDNSRETAADPTTAVLARSTALMTSNQYVTQNAQGQWQLDFYKLSDPESYNVCSTEKFSAQNVPPIACSGFLVAPDLMLTAGHCMIYSPGPEIVNGTSPFCDTFVWVFDYQTGEDGQAAPLQLPAEDVVRCQSVIDAVFEPSFDPTTHKATSGRDFALVRLEHAVTGRMPLKLASADPTLGAPLTSIGYPIGLPAKFNGPSPVSDVSDPHALMTHLNGIGGDSGSPVFNSRNEVVGILVRGLPDDDFFTPAGSSCLQLNHCDAQGQNCDSSDQYAPGTYVQRIRDIAPLLSPAISK